MVSKNLAKRLPQSLRGIMLNLATSYITDVRNKAMQDLKAFFEQKTIPHAVFEYKSLLWLWDGLASGMVRQDHPLMQEALADKMTELIHLFTKHKTANNFFKAALEVIPRYWSGLPHCMLNKMMMLFRRAYRQALFRLADHNWEYIDSFVAVLEQTVIRPLDDADNCEMHIKSFLVEIYLEELAKANNECLDASKIMTFLQPYIKVLTVSSLTLYKGFVRVYIFNYLMRQSDLGISNRADLLANEFVVDETGKKVTDTFLDEAASDSSQSDDDSEQRTPEMAGEMDSGESDEGSEGSDEEDEDIEDSDADIEESDDENEEMEESDEEDEVSDEENEDNEEEEEDEGMGEGAECSDEETVEEDALDPRAGSVDVILPQLDIDCKYLADALLKAEESCPFHQERKRIRKLALRFMDLAEGVFSLGSHPSLSVPKNRFTEDPSVNFEKALSRRLAVEDENKKLPVPVKGKVSSRQSQKINREAKRLGKLVHKEQIEKKKALSANRRAKAKRREQREFDRYARRTARMTQKLQERRDDALIAKKKKKIVPVQKKKELLQQMKEKRAQARRRLVENSAKKVDAAMKQFSANLKPAQKASSKEASSNKKAGSQTVVSTATATPVKTKKSKPSEQSAPKSISVKVDSKSSKKQNTSQPPQAAIVSKKSKSASTGGIKINLKENKHQDFSEYKKSVKASPAIPFQPDRAPLRTALKATNSPILVKKSKTLSKNKDVFRGVQKKTIKKAKEVKTDKSIKKRSNSTSPVRPVAKKLPSKRAVAADFF